MVRNFRGQVRITDVQAEFDALIAKINADIEEYNKVINENENIDFTHGSPSLSGSGYCLTVGGLKKLLAAYNGTMMGAKPFRNSAGDTLVTAGVLVQSTGCSPTTGAIVDNTGRHLYYNPIDKDFTISNDNNVPTGGGYWESDFPKQNSNDGTYYSIDTYFEGEYSTSACQVTGDGSQTRYPITLTKYGASIQSGNNCMRFTTKYRNDTDRTIKYRAGDNYYKITIELTNANHNILTQECNLAVNLESSGTHGLGIEIPVNNILQAQDYQDPQYPRYRSCTIEETPTNGRIIKVTLFNEDEDGDDMSTFDIEVGFTKSGTSAGTDISDSIDAYLYAFNIEKVRTYQDMSLSGVCDMNPNRTYPYLKTIHNTELYNLRTNKIITESRNLTNGSKKRCSKIANDTWTADDNKNESIFVSYNARHSNDGQPNPPVYLNIEGLRSNFNMGTRFTHGSSTSACYRFPKFFFLPKGCRNPFSTTDINTNRIRYNKYKCNITQKK